MVVQQVDLVDVQDAAMRGCEQTRLETAAAFADGGFYVQRTDHCLFGCAHWQLYEPDLSLDSAPLFARAEVAAGEGSVRLAAVRAACDYRNLGQQGSEGARSRGFCRAFLTANQHAADSRIDGVQDQRQFHPLLADDGGEGEDGVLVACCELRHFLFLGSVCSSSRRTDAIDAIDAIEKMVCCGHSTRYPILSFRTQ